jgi:hypothetical protein
MLTTFNHLQGPLLIFKGILEHIAKAQAFRTYGIGCTGADPYPDT